MNTHFARLQHYWQQRSIRERIMLSALGAFLLLTSLSSLLISAHEARQRLLQKRPLLQHQLLQLRQQAARLPRLQAQALPVQAEALDLPGAARQLLQASGLILPTDSLQAAGPRQLQLHAQLPFDAWLGAAGQLQSQMALRLTRCQITTVKTAEGLVSIEAVFALPEPR